MCLGEEEACGLGPRFGGLLPRSDVEGNGTGCPGPSSDVPLSYFLLDGSILSSRHPGFGACSYFSLLPAACHMGPWLMYGGKTLVRPQRRRLVQTPGSLLEGEAGETRAGLGCLL